jgi:hypothetical protein
MDTYQKRFKNAYQYFDEFFPELSEADRNVMADALVIAIFSDQADPDFEKQAD